MATIPVIQDSAQLQTDTGRQRMRADPDAFGAQEARATGAVAQGLGQVAQAAGEIDDDFNEAEARELDNQLSQRIRERLYNTNDGYLSTQRGRNAIDARAQVEADIDAYASELAGAARNPRAAAMFQQVARQRVTSALGSVATYASEQNTAYQNEVSEARLNEFIDNAVAAYADPAAVAEQINAAVGTIQPDGSYRGGELEAVGRRLGWTPEVLDQRRRQFQSDVTSRVIVHLATIDPAAAEEMWTRVRPVLTAQEAGELLTTIRGAQREAEDGAIDEAWTYVAGGQRIPDEVWQRVPGRARIDIQNEQRRRAEGRAGTGDRNLINALDVMSDEQLAQADLWAVRGALGSQFQRFAARQREIREGAVSADVTRIRTTFNALRDIAETTLGVDLSPTESTSERERRRAVAFEAALLREVQQFQALNPGAPINNEVANTLIGRAWVGMRGEGISRQEGRVEGNGSRRRTATTEVVVPYRAIPRNIALRLGARLQRRLGGRQPTEGQVEGAYAALIVANPQTPEEVDAILDRIVGAGANQ